MKKYIYSAFVISFMLSCKCNKASLSNPQNKEVIIKSEIVIKSSNNYEIIKLDSIQNVYLIYGKRNDSIFKIASSKNKVVDCNPIKIGDLLELKLKSTFSDNFYQKRDIAGIKFNGTIIKLKEEGVVWDLFTSDNIKGLCFIK